MAPGRRRAYLPAMIDDLYSARLLALAANMPRSGRLAAPHGTGEATARLCGSRAVVDVVLDADGRIADFAQTVKACALGQASSSIMARNVVGSTAAELREIREVARRMLKENGAAPEGKWADLRVLEPVRDYKARHASTLLTFDAVVDAIGQIEAKRNVAAE